MKRSLSAALTLMVLLGSGADAARRSGGGFGGSRSTPRVTVPRVTVPRVSVPRTSPPRTSPPRTTAPRPTTPVPSRSPAATQRGAALPSTANVRSSPANLAAAASVTPSQISAWKSAPLPAGVPRNALTYSATRSSAYPYQLQDGRYYPYPQGYYRRNGIGSSLFRTAVVFLAVDAVADAVALDHAVPITGPTTGTGDLSDVPADTGAAVTVPPPASPNVWAYAGVGALAAGVAWLVFGRRKAADRQ